MTAVRSTTKAAPNRDPVSIVNPWISVKCSAPAAAALSPAATSVSEVAAIGDPDSTNKRTEPSQAQGGTGVLDEETAGLKEVERRGARLHELEGSYEEEERGEEPNDPPPDAQRLAGRVAGFRAR